MLGAGQRKMKLDGAQTAKMVQESARGPQEHQQLITAFRQKLSMLQDDPTCRAFQVKPDETPAMVLTSHLLGSEHPVCLNSLSARMLSCSQWMILGAAQPYLPHS